VIEMEQQEMQNPRNGEAKPSGGGRFRY
jgi:hypothetical protein